MLELNPYNKCQLHLLKSLAQNGSFDFWSYSNVLGTPSTVMVPPRTQMYLIETLDAARIPYTVIIRNVERYKGIK